MSSPLHILAIADDRAGTQSQAVGLAEAVAARLGDVRLQTLVIERAKGWPGRTKLFSKIAETVPDVAIGCGRAAQAELRVLRKRGVKTVYVQDPRRGYAEFDLVVSPEHDGVGEPNAIAMIGSPNRVSEEALAEAKAEWAELGALPSPRVAVLIGGPSGAFELSAETVAAHVAAMGKVLAQGGSLMVSTSRRTPAGIGARLEQLAVKHPDRVRVYAGDGANPYLGYLAHADAVLVTEESVNMLAEACATGVPVFRLPMAGEAGKFVQFHDRLAERCGVERFAGNVAGMPYAPLRETERVAALVVERLGLG